MCPLSNNKKYLVIEKRFANNDGDLSNVFVGYEPQEMDCIPMGTKNG